MPSRQTDTWPDLSVFDPETGQLDTQGTPPPQRQPAAMPQISEEHVYANSPEFKMMIRKAMDAPESLTKTEQQQVQQAIDLGIVPDIFAQAQEGAKDKKQEAFDKFIQEQSINFAKNADKPFLEQYASVLGEMIKGADEFVSSETPGLHKFSEELGSVSGQELMAKAFDKINLVPYEKGAKAKYVNREGEIAERDMMDGEIIAVNLARGAARLAPELIAGFADNPYEFMKALVKFPIQETQLLLTASGLDLSITWEGLEEHNYSTKEILDARAEVMRHPLGVALLGLIGLGLGARSALHVGSGKKPSYIMEKTELVEKRTARMKEAETETAKVKTELEAVKKEGVAPVSEQAMRKEPWEMTRGEFDKEFWFHGKGTEHPLYGKPQITGGVTKSFKDAVRYSKNITLGKEGEIGEVYLIRKREISVGARKELAWQVREQRRAGIKYKPSIVGSQKGRTIESKIVVPANVPAPHRFLVERAIAEGKPVPKEVLKDYPDLAKKAPVAPKAAKVAETPESMAEDLGLRYEGLQEKPKKDVKGKIIKDEKGDFVLEHWHTFTDPKTGSTFVVQKLSDVPEHLSAMREKFAAAKKPKEILGEKPTEAKPIEGEVIGLKKTEIDRIREALPDIERLEAPKRKSFEKSMAEAKDAKLDVNALETAKAITESNRPTTAAEHAGMVSKAVDLAKEYNERLKTHSELIEKGATAEAQLERGFITALTKDLDVLTEASERFGGTETARALSIRRMMRKIEDNSPSGVVRRGRVFKGKPLTETETGRLEASGQHYEVIRKRLEEVEAKLAETETAREKAVAERITVHERKKARQVKKTKSEAELIMVERADIKKALTELGYRVNDVTGVTTEGAYLVSRLAVSYIREGITTLDAVVKKVLADVPELTASDVYKSIANKEGRRQTKARSEVTKRIAQMKRQAKLLADIEKAEHGIFDKPKKPQPQPADIRALQKQLRDLRTEAYRSDVEAVRLEKALQKINELQDQLDNYYRAVKKQKRIPMPELISAKEKMQEIRKAMRVEDELAQLNEQQRTGEYEVRERPKPKEVPPELERQQVELDRARKRNRGEIERLAPITTKRVAAETVGALRTAKATADLSGTLRQGLGLIFARPSAFPKSFAKSLVATFSEFKAEAIDLAIRSHPNHYLRERAGVEFTELGGKLSGREEMISSNIMEKIPVYGEVVKGSQRHMTTFLNLMRASVFDGYLDLYPNAMRAELARWGNSINVLSGRGTIGKYGGLAQWVAFAPRFAVSRAETPALVFRHWKEPRVRKEIAKTYARTAILGGSLLAMAKLAGLDVGISPRDPDFGKIVVGDTRIDVWAGVQQPIRLVTRIGLAFSDRVGLTGKDMADSEKQLDPIELVGRFAAFKLAPAITLPTELLTSKTMVGEERTPTETGIHAVLPMVYEDILDAYRLEGTERAAVVGGLVTLGVGVSTYEKSKSDVRRQISKLLREKKRSDAIRKALEWNREHPDQPIRTVSGIRLTKPRKKSVFAPEGR